MIDRADWIPKRERNEGSYLGMGNEWPSMFSLSATLNRYHIFIRYCWWDAAGTIHILCFSITYSFGMQAQIKFCLKISWTCAMHRYVFFLTQNRVSFIPTLASFFYYLMVEGLRPSPQKPPRTVNYVDDISKFLYSYGIDARNFAN